MPKLTGQCLCGDVKFEAEGEIAMIGNCHCTDCQQVSGSAYATLIFVSEENVKIKGEVKSFAHKVDSGNTLIKEFIKPQFNVFASRKLDCVTLDEAIPAFDKMPG